jgi:hypothetical protein
MCVCNTGVFSTSHLHAWGRREGPSLLIQADARLALLVLPTNHADIVYMATGLGGKVVVCPLAGKAPLRSPRYDELVLDRV